VNGGCSTSGDGTQVLSLLAWRAFWDLCLVNLSHVLNHLVFPREATRAFSMASGLLTVNKLNRGTAVYILEMTLEIRFPRKPLELMRARMPGAIKLSSLWLDIGREHSS